MKTTQERLQEHYEEALEYFPKDRIVGIFLQGSQNYGLDVEGSDVDSKLIVVPSFEDIVMARQPVSTTHVRANEEHIDFKDIRLMLQTFRKQNLNFVEILFTPYFILNPMYADSWNELVANNEKIAHYCPYQAVKTMKGIAMEKYHAMEHRYPSKIAVIDKYGYDPKQLHHLLRVEEYLFRYINGETYANCLRSKSADYLKRVKQGELSWISARAVAGATIDNVTEMADDFCAKNPAKYDKSVDELLDRVQYAIMEKAVREELNHREG